VASKRKQKTDDLNQIMSDRFHSSDPRAMVIARGFAARALNMDESDIPEEHNTPAKLHAWVQSILACAGGIEHSREIYDRLAPKPKRVEVSGPGGGPIRQAITTGDDPMGKRAAEQYLEEISLGPAGAALADDVDVDVDDILG